jgi:hypothetical protein
MKNIWRTAMAAFALFAFAACDTNENSATESETIETEEVEMDLENDFEEDNTLIVEDTIINDGVADEIPEEQPPIE